MNVDEIETQPAPAYERRLSGAWRDFKFALAMRWRRWQEWRLYRLLDAMEGDSNIVAHIRREMPQDDDEMGVMMRAHLIRMGQLFAIEGHSGFSANYAISALEKLLRFEPLGPLTGEADEWVWLVDEGEGPHPEMVAQNKRASHVFMRADGTAYDINGQIFRDPDGVCYMSRGSAVEVTFPYSPDTEYVDVDYDHEDDDDGR